MDHDDPIFHNRFVKFIKSTGSSLLSYAMGDQPKAQQNVELLAKQETLQTSTNGKSAVELGIHLTMAKREVENQIKNLAELCRNVETFIQLIAK